MDAIENTDKAQEQEQKETAAKDEWLFRMVNKLLKQAMYINGCQHTYYMLLLLLRKEDCPETRNPPV